MYKRQVRASKDVVNFIVDWGSFGSPVPMSIAELTAEMIFSTRMEVISALMPHFDRHDKREALTVSYTHLDVYKRQSPQ